MNSLWIVNQYAVTPDEPGGTRHYEMASELAAKGFGVTVFASDVNLVSRTHTKLRRGQLYSIEEFRGFRFVWIYSPEYRANDWRRLLNVLYFAVNFLRVAGRLGVEGKPSLILGSSPNPLAALAALLVASRWPARFLLEIRDLWPDSLVDMGAIGPHSPISIALTLLDRFLLRGAERVIVFTPKMGDIMTKRGVPKERIMVIPNGVRLSTFRPSMTRDEARDMFGMKGFTLVYAGAHGPANNLETVVEAASILKNENVSFLMVGDGPAKKGLVQSAADKGLSNIRFADPIPKAQIPNLLLGADAGIITLRNAKAYGVGLNPNKLFDYMAAALPVVCSVPGAEFIRSSEAGLSCATEDPQALANAVRTLVALSPEERHHLGLNGQRLVELRHSREQTVSSLAELLSSTQ